MPTLLLTRLWLPRTVGWVDISDDDVLRECAGVEQPRRVSKL